MDPEFWKLRWQNQQIGFHEGKPNALLIEFGEKLLPEPSKLAPSVLVPLCGKALDLLWLSDCGFEVTGIELVERAAQAFFEENALSFERENWHGQPSLVAEKIRIVVADIFALGALPGGTFDAVYDRAALVALQPELRERYVAELLRWLKPEGKLLVLAFVYDQTKMAGPPFSVSDEQLLALYDASARLELLRAQDILDQEPRFKERGLAALVEKAWLVKRRVKS